MSSFLMFEEAEVRFIWLSINKKRTFSVLKILYRKLPICSKTWPLIVFSLFFSNLFWFSRQQCLKASPFIDLRIIVCPVYFLKTFCPSRLLFIDTRTFAFNMKHDQTYLIYKTVSFKSKSRIVLLLHFFHVVWTNIRESY